MIICQLQFAFVRYKVNVVILVSIKQNLFHMDLYIVYLVYIVATWRWLSKSAYLLIKIFFSLLCRSWTRRFLCCSRCKVAGRGFAFILPCLGVEVVYLPIHVPCLFPSAVTSVPGPESGAFLTPGSGIGFFRISYPGPNPYFWEPSDNFLGEKVL